jgi:hypothetical protein
VQEAQEEAQEKKEEKGEKQKETGEEQKEQGGKQKEQGGKQKEQEGKQKEKGGKQKEQTHSFNQEMMRLLSIALSTAHGSWTVTQSDIYANPLVRVTLSIPAVMAMAEVVSYKPQLVAAHQQAERAVRLHQLIHRLHQLIHRLHQLIHRLHQLIHRLYQLIHRPAGPRAMAMDIRRVLRC